MLKLFPSDETDFASNGICVLQPLKAVVVEELNGDYYIDLKLPVEYLDYIEAEQYLYCDTPSGTGQKFLLRSFDVDHRFITAKCWHVSHRAQNRTIDYTKMYGSAGQGVTATAILAAVLAAADDYGEMEVGTDIPSDVLHCRTYESETLYDALIDIAETWGGEYERDNEAWYLHQSRGMNRGVFIRYGKNLKTIKRSVDFSDVCTKVLPIGDENTKFGDLAQRSNNYFDMSEDYPYNSPYTKIVNFQQSLNEEDFTFTYEYYNARAQLMAEQAQRYIEENAIPKVSYTMQAEPEDNIAIGDIVTVKDSAIGLDIECECVGYNYDLVSGRYKSVTFDNFRKRTKNVVPSIEKQIEDSKKRIYNKIRALNPEYTEHEIIWYNDLNYDGLRSHTGYLEVFWTLPKRFVSGYHFLNFLTFTAEFDGTRMNVLDEFISYASQVQGPFIIDYTEGNLLKFKLQGDNRFFDVEKVEIITLAAEVIIPDEEHRRNYDLCINGTWYKKPRS